MLEGRDLTKSFGARLALDRVGFRVSAGRVTGFVGANGAGKTTAMRIVMGVLAPDAGTVDLDGARVTAQDRRRFGYMPEERGLYPRMTVIDHIVYLARLHGLDRAAARRSTEDLLERLDLGSRARDRVEALSLGNQQRAQIAAALVHDPELLLLDEPFSGLDPLAVDAVAALLRERVAQGAAVLFSSHQLELVERLCDDVVIIAGGRVRAAETTRSLRTRHARDRYELTAAPAPAWLHDESGVRVVSLTGGAAVFHAPDPETAARVLREAVSRGRVTQFRAWEPALSEIVRDLAR